MLNGTHLNKLKEDLIKLGYSELDITEILSAYTAIIPVLTSISLRIYQEKQK